MRRFCFPCLSLCALLAVPPLARAGEVDKDPVIVVRVRSLETVEDGLRRLSRLTGNHLAKDWLGSKNILSVKDLKGCDSKRPLGLYLLGDNLGGKLGGKEFQI